MEVEVDADGMRGENNRGRGRGYSGGYNQKRDKEDQLGRQGRG